MSVLDDIFVRISSAVQYLYYYCCVSSEAGPSGSRVRTGDVIDLREDDDDEVSVIRISHSPISEAGDCFINFRRQQRGKKPGLKRR